MKKKVIFSGALRAKLIKYLFIVLILFLLSTSLYENYIFYKIPYNPFIEFATDTLGSFYFSENHPDNVVSKSSHNSNTNEYIFKYFSDLKLIPLKEDENREEIYEHKKNIYFSGMFRIDSPPYGNIHINEIYLDNLTILRISSDRLGFKDGYYRIKGDKFDYKYIKDLMSKEDRQKKPH